MMQWAPQIGLAMFVAMVLLMAVRVPIAASMFIPGLVGYWLMTDSTNTLNFLKGSAVARLTVYELSVIPLFLLMGQFATQGGLSRDLFKAAAAVVAAACVWAYGTHRLRRTTLPVPTLAIEGSNLGLNVSFIPKIGDHVHSAVTFQIKYNLAP